MGNQQNIMERRAIPELLDKKYYIPEYQRGYRWEKQQVLDLLNDLMTYFSGRTQGQFYCLQPIVVKEIEIDNENWYEVIDGQQRLTTLRIIMQIFDELNAPKFGKITRHGYTIRYATRPQMEKIFESIHISCDDDGNAIIDETKNEWRDYIDSVYIYNAAKTVLSWFTEKDERKSAFAQNFYHQKERPADTDKNVDYKSVQVVWYETFENKDPHDIFHRMNSLRVELSCPELIRSLFLSTCAEFNLGNDLENLSESVKLEIQNERLIHKQTSINEKWDELEHQMRDSEFQAFLTNRKYSGRNAIGLLFDIISAKYSSDKDSRIKYPDLHKEDSLYTYFFFKNMLAEDGDAWITWERILSAFEKLQSWYHDRDLFHRIGFLNAIAEKNHEDDTICKLLNLNQGKRAIIDKTLELIKDAMIMPIDKDSKKPLDNMESLSYDNSTHYNYIKRLLLLYNIETVRRQKDGDFFSFKRYRYKSDTEEEKQWTLEHIHAQSSDCLPETNKEAWYSWIIYNLDALKRLSLGSSEVMTEKDNTIAELERDSKQDSEGIPVCKSMHYTFDNIKALFESVSNFYAMLDTDTDKASPIHQLSNMALLDLGQNAMVGKSPFEVKRHLICEKLAKDEYFPICTQKVFLKLYDNESTQIHSWSQKDRKAYYDDIKSKLSIYINESIF